MAKTTFGYFSLVFLFLQSVAGFCQQDCTLKQYVHTIKQQGRNPIQFINEQLKKHPLIVFDDALHSAQEPFDFYQDLIRNIAFQEEVKYIFLEVISIAAQPHIEAFLNSRTRDSTLLLKVFQDNFSGYGQRYQTYLDLFNTVWEVNRQLLEEKKLHIIGLDQPIYWEAIHSRQDYDIFQSSLIGRDYFIYKMILKKLVSFKEDKKGIFLTNTRHAYKHIRKANGDLYWNCMTFFDQWHPGKAYSIRIHNVTLSIEKFVEQLQEPRTAQGLERYKYNWVRMADGLWDQAFAENGNKPIAFSLVDNCFGKAPYIGNHMLNAQTNQKMYHAYDALLFLAPLEELHFSAQTNFFYTPSFKKELKRRILLLEGDKLPKLLHKHGINSIENYIEKISAYQPKAKNNLWKK